MKHYKHLALPKRDQYKNSRITAALLKAAPPFQVLLHKIMLEITLIGLITSQSDKVPAGTRQSVNRNHREQTQNKPHGSAGGNEKPSSPKTPPAVRTSLIFSVPTKNVIRKDEKS